MSGAAPIIPRITALPAYPISTSGTGRLCELAGPDPGPSAGIITTSQTEKLYTVTVMSDESGFTRLVTGATPAPRAAEEAGEFARGLPRA